MAAPPLVRRGFCGAVGSTPLIRLERLSAATGCDILAKAEHMGPGGSVKDRAALYMIEAAEASGALKPGGIVIEATAGNTGIGLVLVANAKGYRCKFFLPASTSSEKINALTRLGAEAIVCATCSFDDPRHFQRAAKACAEQTDNSFFTQQFWNEAHIETTGPEIWQQTEGKLDAFTCAAGTGGTIGGCSAYLKEISKGAVKCYLMDPSSVGIKYHLNNETRAIEMSEKTAEEKKQDTNSVLEGIGSGKLYLPLSRSRLDAVLTAPDALAFEMAQFCLRHEGLYIGPSAALNVLAALWVAKLLGPGSRVVTVLCDGGNNYASRDAAWLATKGIAPRADVTAEQLISAFNRTQHTKIALPDAFVKAS